jgi:CheY-like chemotaxis protein
VSRRVLLVEDVEDNRKLFGDLLRFGGWEVEEAETGEQAIAVAHDQAFNLVLMDLSLPGKVDGWGAMKAIRQTSRVPIVALTAHAMVGDAERALAEGFDGYITKPIEIDAFLSQIDEVAAHA